MPYDVLHERCDYDFLIHFGVKYEIFAIFSDGSSTYHTGFSDPGVTIRFNTLWPMQGI